MGNEKKEYYVGLDIGTDSVGYAVTDEQYQLIKFKGEPMWGSHLFDAAKGCAERRAFRTARRRLDRRQQRVLLVDEIIAPEIAKVDEHFYIRKKQSALYKEDREYPNEISLYFNEKEYNDSRYYKDFPTIHHLLWTLMQKWEKKYDIRLLNIAIDYLVAHRGHFLSEVGTDNIDRVMDFRTIYDEFINCFDDDDETRAKPWDTIDAEEFGKILKLKGIKQKGSELKKLLYDNKNPDEDPEYFLSKKELLNFLAGGKVQGNKLFHDSEFEDDFKISIGDISNNMEEYIPLFGDDADLIAKMVAMYDWSVLSEILAGSKYISESKVKEYEQHKKDLHALKKYVKKYAPEKYEEVFRKAGKELANYTAYSYNFNSVKKGSELPKKKADREAFYTYLKKALSLEKMSCDNKMDDDFKNDMLERMKLGSFMPKQVNTDNRVIPYQLYFIELQKILENAAEFYPFLLQKDDAGISPLEKIKSIFTFRIPYFVGPLKNEERKNPYSWIVRKAEGKIYPWNFREMVDLDKSEEAFINRMTNMCTYIPGKDVLPKWSLLYTKYTVLNEINNIKSNGMPISVKAKQGIFNDLFCKKSKVTPKDIYNYLLSNALIQKEDEISGLDEKINASLKPWYEFRNLLGKGILKESEVEEIIARRTYTEDSARYKKWLKESFANLSEADMKYVSKLKYSDFGRLSAYFLCEFEGTNKETGEVGTIMHFLWETNDNLMKILSDRYSFMEQIVEFRQNYYAEHKMTLAEQMEDLGISNAVKRPVKRTLAVVDDVVSAMGYPPKKIFVEMARGADEKKKRSVTRKDQILSLYKAVEEDTKELEKQLDAMGDMANNRLQSDALFLYYMQLGKCMYSGEPIDLSLLKTDKYNIDHIYPQSLVKDDSILNNRVLVLSKNNGDKKDIYPIESGIRSKMHSFWNMLVHNGLITKEKYNRLTRSTGFTDEEKEGFINRQLVETRQSMKAVTQLLGNLYPESEIIYVKAKLAAGFKQEFELAPKSRIVNDLHHAKDAYLNIVAGNVYHERFTKKWFHISDTYSMNTRVLFTKDLIHGDQVIWSKDRDLKKVKDTYAKNNIHLTRYAFCQKGGLFDQMPVKKGLGQASLRDGLDIGKYGGYNKVTSSFFVIAKYFRGGKKEVSFVPVDLMVKDRFLRDENFAVSYVQSTLQSMNSKKVEQVEFPLGKRIVKYKSVLSLDGFKVWVNGKANKGAIVLLTSAESLSLNAEKAEYIKKIENYVEKKKMNPKLIHDSENDRLSEGDNIKLYDTLVSKLGTNHFRKMPGNQYDTLNNGFEKFRLLQFEEQIKVLLNCIELLKSGRTGGCDLKAIGGSSASGVPNMGSNLSSSKYLDIRLIDVSPAGLHEKKSVNLMELLK